MKENKLVEKTKKLIPSVALKLGNHTSTQISAWWFYQPKVPEQLKKETK